MVTAAQRQPLVCLVDKDTAVQAISQSKLEKDDLLQQQQKRGAALRAPTLRRVQRRVATPHCHKALSFPDKEKPSKQLRFRTVKIIYDVYISKVCQLFQAIKPT